MDERQRYVATLTFGNPDRVPLQPGWPRESTLRTWRQQGLPAEVDWYTCLLAELGIDYTPPAEKLPNLSAAFRMLPTFEEKVLEHRDGHYIVQDWMGAITEISDQYDYTYIRSAKDFVTRRWHRFPVGNRADWEEKMAWRYDPGQPGRFPADFDGLADTLAIRKTPFTLSVSGPFWQLREWCGFEGLCTLMITDPAFVLDMAQACCTFVLETLKPVLARLTPDMFLVNEDMAYKAHSMISPRMVRRFLLPVWQAWNQALCASGCPLLAVDSDGYVGELLPLWLEAGFNCCTPLEVAAGNDLPAYRRQYGRRMAYTGGIDKRALAAGGSALRQEVFRVVPPLLEEGGFIPGCDHGVPPDISWANFKDYTRLLAELTGWL
jgi:hypothetical protein